MLLKHRIILPPFSLWNKLSHYHNSWHVYMLSLTFTALPPLLFVFFLTPISILALWVFLILTFQWGLGLPNAQWFLVCVWSFEALRLWKPPEGVGERDLGSGEKPLCRDTQGWVGSAELGQPQRHRTLLPRLRISLPIFSNFPPLSLTSSLSKQKSPNSILHSNSKLWWCGFGQGR